MTRNDYSSPELITGNFGISALICQSGFQAQDVNFGGNGEAGQSFSDTDVNYGGSF